MKTYSARPVDIDRRWYVVDASREPLGRLATKVATVLRGKHKPMFTPHMDTGDHVVVINADQLLLSGNKTDKKVYDRYSGFPSGRFTRTAREQMDRDSTRVVEDAIKGMLPKTKLGRAMFKKLKVYAGAEHPHGPQKPEEFPLA